MESPNKLDTTRHYHALCLRITRSVTKRQGWQGCDLFERLKAHGLVHRQYVQLNELEAAGLVPSERVEYGSPEYNTRVRLRLPTSPPRLRPGQWCVYPLDDTDGRYNARIVSVMWDRNHWSGGWRGSFYGYSALMINLPNGPNMDLPFVEYVKTGDACGARIIGPAMNAELALREEQS